MTEIELRSYSGKFIVLDLTENIFYSHNKEMFLEMCDVINEKPKWASNIITHSKKHIYEWIRSEANRDLLDESIYNPNTLIYWVLHGI